jgi:hypothetical protein
MTARDLKLDYFRIYDIENRPAKGALATRGQFDRTPKRGQLGVLDLFAACTMKNREPLFDKYAHLTWYRLLQEGTEPTRAVTVRNQFGTATLWIGKVEALLCPAQKLEKGSEPPGRLDHYKVYRVLDYGQPPNAVVTLRDQFGSERAKVLVPDFFAVPVWKQVGRKQFPIINRQTHLVIYRTSQKPLRVRTIARDQFGRWPIQLIRGVALAVPSLKLRWK